jgi:hypothetical protein
MINSPDTLSILFYLYLPLDQFCLILIDLYLSQGWPILLFYHQSLIDSVQLWQYFRLTDGQFHVTVDYASYYFSMINYSIYSFNLSPDQSFLSILPYGNLTVHPQNFRLQKVRFQYIRFPKRPVFKTSGFKTYLSPYQFFSSGWSILSLNYLTYCRINFKLLQAVS